jgi:predicted short-subunit dehydrogenase-like oxidoreductase (DUF2520 family)
LELGRHCSPTLRKKKGVKDIKDFVLLDEKERRYGALVNGPTLAVSFSPMASAMTAENSRRSMIHGVTTPVAHGDVPVFSKKKGECHFSGSDASLAPYRGSDRMIATYQRDSQVSRGCH